LAGINVFGSSAPAGLVAFKEEEGEPRDDFRLKDYAGKAIIFAVQGPEEVNTTNGPKVAVRADVTVLSGTADAPEGKDFRDVLIFNQVPVTQLRPLTGQTIVAVVETYKAKSGTIAPKLAEPAAEVVKVAEKYLAGRK
jgi:hypothetical protein